MVRAASVSSGIVHNVVVLESAQDLQPDQVLIPEGVPVEPGDFYVEGEFAPDPVRIAAEQAQAAEAQARYESRQQDAQEAQDFQDLDSNWSTLTLAQANTLLRRLVRAAARMEKRIRVLEDTRSS